MDGFALVQVLDDCRQPRRILDGKHEMLKLFVRAKRNCGDSSLILLNVSQTIHKYGTPSGGFLEEEGVQ